jgi:hypothetical protein
MRVFIERFVLAILASLVVLLAAINPMGFSGPLRVISIIVIVIVAGAAAHFAGWDEWRWERLRAVWWLWLISGVSGGVALALWLSPLVVGPPPQDLGLLQTQISVKTMELDNATKQLKAAQSELASRQTEDDETKRQLGQRISQLELQLSAAKQELENTKQAANVAQNVPPRVGPINTLNTFSAAEGLFEELLPSNTSVLVTAMPENERVKNELNNLLGIGQRKIRDKLPEGKSLLLYESTNTLDLDAPHPTSLFTGIVIHGARASGNALIDLKNILEERCLDTPRTTAMVPDEIKKYYKSDNIIWIEIGKGSPWRTGRDCSE